MAPRYNLQRPPAITPVLVVYHDNALLPGYDHPDCDRNWTLAFGSGSSSMPVNSVPNATGLIAAVKSVEFRDRYVVVDPQTMSISTYKPYVPMVGASRDLGSHAGSILSHPVEYVRENPPKGFLKLRERWYAVDLNCAVLREYLTTTDGDGKESQIYCQAVSVKAGKPPADYFDIPSDDQERGPAEVNNESGAS